MTKKYYYLTANNEIKFLGEFATFNDAWEFANYDSDKSFVYIFKIDTLIKIKDQINRIITI